MRTNMPVTNNEYVLTDNDSIVSKTDLQGKITYVNDDFKRISGFSEAELIGEPQNIVRHPDMPVEAFADFWATLKAGRPWTGMVKNRCKNGDYYWVVANATPLVERGQHIGYMSVRGKPSRRQVEAADQAYSLFRDGKASGLKIKDGKVVKSGLLGKLNVFKDMSIKARVVTIIAVLSVMLLGIGGLGVFSLSKSNESLRTVYEDRVIGLAHMTSVIRGLARNRIAVNNALVFTGEENVKEQVENIAKNKAIIDKAWDGYMATYSKPDEQALAGEFLKLRTEFVNQGLLPAAAALRSRDFSEARRIVESKFAPLYKPVSEKADELIALQLNETKMEYEQAKSNYASARNVIIATLIIGLSLAVWLGFMLIRAIIAPLHRSVGYFGKIAEGKYDNVIEIDNHDEIGKVMDALQAMQVKLGFDVNETKRIANAATRIQIALDNVATNVMIADNDRTIIYMNKSVDEMLKNAEKDIQKDLPKFDHATLRGTSIDSFHKNPAHQKQLLATFTTTFKTEIMIGGRTFSLVANPVMNAKWGASGRSGRVERPHPGSGRRKRNGRDSRGWSEWGLQPPYGYEWQGWFLQDTGRGHEQAHRDQ